MRKDERDRLEYELEIDKHELENHLDMVDYLRTKIYKTLDRLRTLDENNSKKTH